MERKRVLKRYRIPVWSAALLAILLSGGITVLCLWCQPNRLRDVLDRLPGPILLDLEKETDWDGERFLFGIGKGRKPRGEG